MGKVQGHDTTDSGESSKAKRRAFFLWNRLRQMYGSRFLDQFGTEPNDLWITAVDGLLDAQIKLALQRLVREGSQHPPTLPEFMAIATKPQSSTVNTYTAPANVGTWQKLANRAFHDVLKESLLHGRTLYDPERSEEVLEALRKLKATYAEAYGSDPSAAEQAEFMESVRAMLRDYADA